MNPNYKYISLMRYADSKLRAQHNKGLRYLENKNRIWEWNGQYTHLAIRDLTEAFHRWPLWVRLGWQDVLLRYRRSMIGPFWLTLSMGVMVFSLGLLYGSIFKIDTSEYLPYLTIGLLSWNLISSVMTEGCNVFIESEWLIRQVDLPIGMFPLRVVWRNLILFFHNLPIYIIVVVLFDVPVNWSVMLAIPGLIIFLANACWCVTLLGMLSSRFRDLPQIVGSILQISFFVTPIIWTTEQASRGRFFVQTNPFYHFIEVLRQPLLGGYPNIVNWLVCIGILCGGFLVTFLFYRRFHGRIAYWV